MLNQDRLLSEYDEAIRCYSEVCVADPGGWHQPDFATFRALRLRLLEHAESGNVRCLYALATILWLGLCHATESEQLHHYDADIQEASRYWDAAAAQGYWPAIDNLIACGAGTAAERARQACRDIEKETPELILWQGGMPVYGPTFMETVRRRVYGYAGST